jgi:membrane protease YdiL (CAAX protease family)
MNAFRRLWTRAITESIETAERDSLEALTTRKSAVDSKTMIVCVVVAIDLALLQYFGLSDRIGWVPDFIEKIGFGGAANDLREMMMTGPNARLMSLFYWVASCVVVYVVIPASVVVFVFKQSLADYGLRLRGALKHWWIYVGLLLIVMPAVVGVSFSERFQEQYPFYRDYTNQIPAGFIYWELAYALQFLALEFFFRGFMINGLKERFGFYAVFVMMVPYCMIHFGKPFPETMGAIVAGFALGVLALRTGTIWLGFLVHVSVALSMDMLALWHRGLF